MSLSLSHYSAERRQHDCVKGLFILFLLRLSVIFTGAGFVWAELVPDHLDSCQQCIFS